MVAITDKFGKASAPDAYAPATTVKNVKNAGESTLSAYDLSKFDDTVPLFFITYKKTTHPETGATIRLNQAGWKGLVNKDSNTITNLVLAPGYTDPGQAPGDYIEAIPTSFWANELVDGILVSHNPDGTLKNNAVTTAKIADSNVTTAKIANNAVTAEKIDWATLNAKVASRTTEMALTTTNQTVLSVDVSGFPVGAVLEISASAQATGGDVLTALRLTTNVTGTYLQASVWGRTLAFVGAWTKTSATNTINLLASKDNSQTLTLNVASLIVKRIG